MIHKKCKLYLFFKFSVFAFLLGMCFLLQVHSRKIELKLNSIKYGLFADTTIFFYFDFQDSLNQNYYLLQNEENVGLALNQTIVKYMYIESASVLDTCVLYVGEKYNCRLKLDTNNCKLIILKNNQSYCLSELIGYFKQPNGFQRYMIFRNDGLKKLDKACSDKKRQRRATKVMKRFLKSSKSLPQQ